MAKLTDMQIKAWIKAGERFEGRADGDGLWLRFREADKVPVWRYRYRFEGKQRTMQIGTYAELSLAKARETARELAARVALGYDVAGEKQERKAAALAKIEDEKNAITMLALANEYYERMILGRWKHPDIVRRRIDKDIGPALGHMKVEDIKPRQIDDMLQSIVKRGAPSIANDTLRWVRRMFDYGIKRHILEIKTYNRKSFDKLTKDGVQKTKFQHYVQMQLYMLGTGIDRAFYIAICKDSDEIYTERIRFDKELAEKYLERGKRIALAERMPEPLSADPSWHQCQYCPAHSMCFAKEPTKCVNCRTCLFF